MKKNILVTVYTIFFSIGAYSQELNLDLLSDLSPAQLEMAKTQLNSPINSEKPPPQVTDSTVKVEEENIEDLEESDELSKYGYDYFSSIPTTIAAVGDLPLPNDYKISLKDQFTIILSGSKEMIFDLDVNLDGTILFPELGSVSVVGKTLRDVKNMLNNLIEQSYIGVQIDVSLKNLAAKKITIVGAVNTPGSYLVNPFSTISSALAYSGGISEIGTLRKIKLVRTNGDIHFFDLYELLIDGNREDDMTIEAGDVIVIDAASQFIELTGEIKRPAKYEVLEGEDLSDLISFGLGFTNIANKSNIDINFLDLANGAIENITTGDLSENLSNFLSVNINPYNTKSFANIRVDGAVKEPGFYSLNKYKNLDDLINVIEFVDVYPWLGVLEQFDENTLERKTILFSLKDKNTYRGVKLLPNSRIFFADRNLLTYKVSPETVDDDDYDYDVLPLTKELIEDYSLRINHKNSSYTLPVFGNFYPKSFVDFLGLDMSNIDSVATYISPLDNLVIERNFAEMDLTAKKFQTITFRSPINDLISVQISGAIDYPGTYTLQSNASLQDLYSIIGSFKSEAFLEGIIFTREVVRERQMEAILKSKDELSRALTSESLKKENANLEDIEIARSLSEDIEPQNLGRIAGNFGPDSENIDQTFLSDGDSIFVPKKSNFINVLGEVLNPLAFEFTDNLNIERAIRNAGGLRKDADSKRIYVIKANGMIFRKGRNVFGRDFELQPGDTIIVPKDIVTSNPALNAILPVTNIISDLAFSAAAIESLSNSN